MQQFIYFYNHVSVIFYLFKHLLYNNLSIYYDQLNLLKLLSLLFLGVLTSITPCFLSILPIIISSTTLFKYFNSTKLVLLLGLVSSLLLIILILYIGNNKFYNLFSHIPLMSSIIFIFIALNILGILNISYFVNSFDNLNTDASNNIYLQSYFMGFSIGLSSLPCNCSLILTTILWIYSSDKIIESFIYLFIYLFGCLLPFFIIFILPLELMKFQKFVYLWNYIIPLGGFYMLTFGFFIFFQQLL